MFRLPIFLFLYLIVLFPFSQPEEIVSENQNQKEIVYLGFYIDNTASIEIQAKFKILLRECVDGEWSKMEQAIYSP